MPSYIIKIFPDLCQTSYSLGFLLIPVGWISCYNTTMAEGQEKLVKTTVYLEEELLEALDEYAEKYSKETGQKWSRGAVIRLALSEFFSRQGRIL